MSADRETTRVVRSWLEEGVTALPDRVLDAVLDQVPATPQRRHLWSAWRYAKMNTYAKLVAAAAAVLVVAVIGYVLIPRGSNVATPPSPTPIVTAPAAPPPVLGSGDVAAGTYLVHGWDQLLDFTITVPAGWRFNADGFLIKGDQFERAGATGVALSAWQVSHVYADACQWAGTLRAVETSQALLTALRNQDGYAGGRGGTADTSIGGLPTTPIEISVFPDFDLATCQSSVLRLWPDPGPDENGGHRIWPGQTTTVYPVEKGGKVYAIFTVRNVGSPSADVAEVDAMLHSIQFLP